MGELSGPGTHPVVPADHNQGPGGGRPAPDGAAARPGDRTPVVPQPPDKPPADQRGGDGAVRPDAPQTPPGRTGPITEHPDVQQYMQLGKQTPETPSPTPAHPVLPADSGAPDAQPLQAPPGATPDGHGTGGGQHPESKPDTAAARPVPAHAADTHGSTTAPAAGHAQDQGSAPGARDQKPGVPEAPEKALDRDVRLHLQPFGVTSEQAHDYMRIVLAPSLHLDATVKGMPPADLQRVGDAVSHLPAPLLDHVVEQAKGLNAHPGASSQSLDTGRVVDGARQFGFGQSLLTPGVVDFAGLPKIPLYSPPPTIVPPSAHQQQFFQPPAPKPGDQPGEAAAKFAAHAAEGAPEHRVADTPDPSKVSDGDIDKLLEATDAPHLLAAQLAGDPTGFAVALTAALAIVAAGAADYATERHAAPGPGPTAAGPTDAVVPLESRPAHQIGMPAVNAFLGEFSKHLKFGVNVEHDKGELNVTVEL